MGYNTEFSGSIAITPPLNPEEIAYLNKFSDTRRMDREKGPYFVDGTEEFGQGKDPDIRNYNSPPNGQPGLWCQWVPTEDGTAIVWNDQEKFYESVAWMEYLIEHFLKPGALAAAQLPFLQANHILNGTITAQGEELDDRWLLVVKDNVVTKTEQGPTDTALNQSERATILAALRFYQESGMGDPTNRSEEIHAIATNNDELTSLDDDGIDDLCTRINV
jgi:hypothetical protein